MSKYINKLKRLFITMPIAWRIFMAMAFVLGLVLLMARWSTREKERVEAVSRSKRHTKNSATAQTNNATPTESIFEQIHFKEVHTDLQRTYLSLINSINSMDTSQINLKSGKAIFYEYSAAQRKYNDVLKKLENYSKEQKLRCFSIMRSVILAILYYDKQTGKKMFKYDPEKLKEEKILLDIPKCPEGGEYSIFYRDGRRFFRCSIHGILRQN